MATLTAQIYSPRWGHNDTCTFEFTKDTMTISLNQKQSKCVYVQNRDPQWEGESVESILNNDSIYGPAILTDLLEHLWTSWRDGELSDAETQVELNAVIDWLNSVTAAKPKTDFWGKYF
jgi:hypothetical protein